MTAIFIFSSQNSVVSGKLSGGITEWIAEKIIRGFDELSQSEKIHTVETMHFYIRKLAHFSIYALLGLISYLNTCQYPLKKSLRIVVSLLFCLVYGASDEFHQWFTDGRCCSPVDIMIDFSGSVFGVIFIIALTALISKLMQKKKVKAAEQS